MALFGKSSHPQEEEKKSTQASSLVPSPPALPPLFRTNSSPKNEGKKTVIGRNIKIQGELSGDEDIVIEGRVEGKISVTKTVRVGESAQVNAEIKAQNVVVAGKVTGNVIATEKIEILPSGSVEGNIRAPKIAIAEGAQFKGSVDMGGKPGPEAPPAAPSAAPPGPNPR